MSLSSAQRQIADSPVRNRVAACGRRFGKTYLAIRELAKFARLPKRRVWYVSPSYRMSKQIAWALLKEKLTEVRWAEKFNEQDLTALLKNGSTISLRGADNPDSLRGVGLDFLVMDEAADIKPEAWFSVLRPTLSDTGGSALFLGTPKGFNWFHKLWDQGQQEKEGWQSWQFTTLDGGNVSEEEIESSRRDLDELTFNAEYLATFLNFSGRAYYPFERSTHCRKLEYDPKQPLIFCYDFNVEPGVAAVCQEQKLPNGLQGTGVIGEVWISRNSNTVAVCKKLLTDWANHEGRITCYGDATGGARGSAKVAGSDWDLIRQTLKHGADGIKGFGDRVIYRVPKANPAERARINAVNTRLKNGAGEIRLMVDPVKAPHVVTDLEGVILLSGGSGELDKRHDESLTHMCFAAETTIDTDQGIFPISEMPKTGKVRTFDGSYVEYISLGMTRKNAETVCVRFDNGDTVLCSPDHPFLTEKGFVHAKNLTGLICYNWLIDANQATKVLAWTLKLSTKLPNISMEGFINPILRASISIVETAKKAFVSKGFCIATYGSSTMAKFQMDTTSTTKTGIQPTTLSTILNRYLTRSICDVTGRAKNGGISYWICNQKLLSHVSILFAPSVENHFSDLRERSRYVPRHAEAFSITRIIHVKRAIARYAKSRLRSLNMRRPLRAQNHAHSKSLGMGGELMSGLVRSVAAPLFQRRTRAYIAACHVIEQLRCKIDGVCSAITKYKIQTESVENSVQGLAQRAIDTKPAGKRDLYCIAVPSTHCFALSNGLIVSNSDGLGYYVNYEFPVVKATATQTRIKGLY